MSLSTGQRLGPYEVVSPLGAGGMGEVFTARDTRLDRLVALKVLPDEVGRDPDRRARFEREARAISALNHPHVCALFDVGRAAGPDGEIEYLVMERLEGETLAARLKRGPLPVREVLELGRQLAEALAAAHRRGIVHRDLKPGNVMLTRSGAKLLDFGLARYGERERLDADEADLTATFPTEARPLTQVGALIGTWQYLAPEQVQGGQADVRSDVFALGCVLHEALTGKRAFTGATAREITTAILETEPADVRETAPAAPGTLAVLVRQCLAKEKDARWQCADDVARGLRLVEAEMGKPETRPRPASSVARWAAGAAVLGVALALVTAALVGRRARPAQPLQFALIPPAGVLISRPTVSTPFAISPDGRRIAFTGRTGSDSSLWLWSAEDGQARRLEETAGGVSPFFSPDGREVAFFAGNELRRVLVDGGPAATIATAPGGSSGSWGSDGTILFTRRFTEDAGVYAVPARGGVLRPIATGERPHERRAYARFLPDGRHYLFLMGFGLPVADRRVCVASIDGGEADCFASCHSQPEYSGSGHVLCVRAGTLVALPFDARTLKPTGEAVAVVRDVRWFGPSGAASFDVSADGSALVTEPRPMPSRLAWLDRSGRELAAVGKPDQFGLLQLSPDGRHVVVDIVQPDGRGRDLWRLDAGSGVASRLTFQALDAAAGAWAPDGKRLVYAKAEEGPPDMMVLQLDGTGREDVLLRTPGVQLPKHWSPDGRLIAYEDYTGGLRDRRQLFVLPLDGHARPVGTTAASTYHGRFSPDGRWLAYVSDESGGPEVYVVSLQGGAPRRVSRAGGLLPRWRGDATELYFLQPDGLMMALPTTDEAAAPKSLFHVNGVTTVDFDYDVARDGQSFLVRLISEAEGSAGLRVSLQWAQRLGTAEARGR